MSVNGFRSRPVVFLLLVLAAGICTPCLAADPGAEAVRSAVEKYIDRRGRGILLELVDLVQIPNLASDAENIGRNAGLLEILLHKRGIATRRLETNGSPPVIFGELKAPGATRTLIMYAHYDGQPVDPARWRSGPWEAEVRDPALGLKGKRIQWMMPGTHLNGEWRLYGRSSSDDKAPIVAFLNAIDALQAASIPRSVNLKFFLEGEEEVGSPHLADTLKRFAHILDADLWVVCDGPIHQSRRMQLFFGARGIIDLEMTFYGSTRPLHSGHYGNWAPNPIAMMVSLVSGMRGPDGDILIPGFSDQVRELTGRERLALEKIPDFRETLMKDLGLAWTEGGGEPLEQLLMRPAMNLRGTMAGGVEEMARNAIPAEARVSIDFRLVPDQTPEFVRARVEEYFRAHSFHIVFEPPDQKTRSLHPRIVKLQWGHGYPPSRASMDLPVSRRLVRILEEQTGGPIIQLPTLGGSGPTYLFSEILDTPAIGIPIVNHDNNQHAADENLRLQNLWDGIEIYASLLARLGEGWDQTEEGEP